MGATADQTWMMPNETQTKMVSFFGQVDDREAFPQVVRRALTCMHDSLSNSSDLAAILNTDQVLVGRLLGMANSVCFRGNHRFVTVHEAVVRLGYRLIHELLIAAGLSDSFQRPLALYEMGRGELWEHSLTTAVAARLVAETTSLVDPDSAYLAGLLHDTGRVVIGRGINKSDAADISLVVRSEQIPFDEAELRVLGFTHADAGALQLSRWQIDNELVEAVANHHHGGIDAGPLAWVVHVADVLAAMAGPLTTRPGWLLCVDPEIAEKTGLQQRLEDDSTGNLDGLLDEIRRGVLVATRLLNDNTTSMAS